MKRFQLYKMPATGTAGEVYLCIQWTMNGVSDATFRKLVTRTSTMELKFDRLANMQYSKDGGEMVARWATEVVTGGDWDWRDADRMYTAYLGKYKEVHNG